MGGWWLSKAASMQCQVPCNVMTRLVGGVSAYCVARRIAPAQRWRQGQRHCAGEGSVEDSCSKGGGGKGGAVWHKGGGVEDEAVPLCLKPGAHTCIGSRGERSSAATGLLWTT